MVVISGLTVTYNRWGQAVNALNNICLSVMTGQWVMLVGHNGSGKSTLLKAIGGQVTPSAGTISVSGECPSDLRPIDLAARVFHVHQDPLAGTAAKMTLFENLLVADHAADGANRRQLLDKYRSLLAPVGLDGRMNQLVQYLSGGERQLVALLIAQLRPSRLLLLDEPLAALDPSRAKLCLDLITKLHHEGRTIMMVTHDRSLVRAGDRTIALHDGCVTHDCVGPLRDHGEFEEQLLAHG